ncbi:hypothetical protein CON36_29335 [Bacillus cereus]|uniref:Zinc ribbon domain-containing protein n=3 Tax=Bacillus cereus group TaxID=86661 RepID=A0A9X6ZQZ9_BACTU|nr:MULTISPECIES: hypothetical protein [Bacillus cereus group]PDZ95261.1 hypothetical protein CON36_29335 [Bacillus cereus]PFJ33214.1 hypothetical protein COJ15_28645 [Bacillus thuringiensis]PGP14448.1 hypothetical protein COA01_29215 [Bacillus cereus]
MHCRSCGEAVLPLGQYCGNCGDDALSKKMNFQLEGKAFPYCNGCGTHNEKGSIHCIGCGNSLVQYTQKSNDSILKKVAESANNQRTKLPKASSFSLDSLNTKDILQTLKLKSILISFSIAFVSTLIFFFVLSFSAKKDIVSFLQEGVRGDFAAIFFGNIDSVVPDFYNKMLGAPFLLLQSLGAKFYMSIGTDGASLYTPIFGLGILIAFVFYLTGKGIRKGTQVSSLPGHIVNSLVVGVLFSICSLVLSFFTKDSVTVDGISSSYGISSISAMWNSFVIGTVFSLIGSLSQQGKEGQKWLPTMTKEAWRTHLIFLAGILIVTIISLFNTNGAPSATSLIPYYVGYIFMLLQWIMVPFGSFAFNVQNMPSSFGLNISSDISMGSFKKIEGKTMTGDINFTQSILSEFSFLHTIMLIALVGLVLYVAFIGYRHASKLQLSTQLAAIKSSLLFGIVFSFIMACWMHFVRMGLTVSSKTTSHDAFLLAPNFLKTLFIAFILISVFHYAGSYWRLHKNGIKW